MLKALFSFAAIALMFSSCPCDNPNSLKENVMIEAFNNGSQIQLSQEDAQTLDKLLCDALEGSRPMPAIGVSIHEDTIKAMECGIWLKFSFDATQKVADMTFDSLAFMVNKNVFGVNIIRGNDGRYDGRCYYIDLQHNLDQIYNFLSQKQVLDTQDDIQTSKIKEVSCQCFGQIPSINKDKQDDKPVITIHGEQPSIAQNNCGEENKVAQNKCEEEPSIAIKMFGGQRPEGKSPILKKQNGERLRDKIERGNIIGKQIEKSSTFGTQIEKTSNDFGKEPHRLSEKLSSGEKALIKSINF